MREFVYRWWKFVHLTGAFAFLLTHGVSVAVMFKIRKERDRERLRALLELSGSTILLVYLSLAILLTGGIVAGFGRGWWSFGWIWVSLGLLVAISGAMFVLGTRYNKRILNGLGTRPSGAPVASDEEIDDLLNSQQPWVVAVIGFGGLLVILWLMVFKPF